MDTHTHTDTAAETNNRSHPAGKWRAVDCIRSILSAYFNKMHIIYICYHLRIWCPISNNISGHAHFFLLQFFFISIIFLRFVFRISYFPVWSSDKERKSERMSKGGLHSAPAAQAAVGGKIKMNKTKKEKKKKN